MKLVPLAVRCLHCRVIFRVEVPPADAENVLDLRKQICTACHKKGFEVVPKKAQRRRRRKKVLESRAYWALGRDLDRGTTLLGKHCWPDSETNPKEPPMIRTFFTRAAAREAKKSCCYKDAEVMRITVWFKED